MKHAIYDHCGGATALPAVERGQIVKAIDSCGVQAGPGTATKIRDEILHFLHENGWSGELALGPGSQITITTHHGSVGLCLQTGNVSRMYADILKLQQLYVDGKLKVGVMVLPSKPAAKVMGDNIANADRLEKELNIFRKVIHLPIAVFSFG